MTQAANLAAEGSNVNSSGVLQIAGGGTGQTTASAAFNSLSPITSTGDLILGNGVNSSTRLAIGTNGYVLTSNGSTASWSAVNAASAGGVVYENGQTISSNYTMTTNNNGMSAGPITINTGVTVTIPTGSTWVIV